MQLTQLPKPKSQLAEVLYGLIVKNEISERDFHESMNGFRSRLSELREYLNIRDQWKQFKSKYGHKGQHKVHYLWESEKKKAVKIYKQINKVA